MILLSTKEGLSRKVINFNGITFTKITFGELKEDYPQGIEVVMKLDELVNGVMSDEVSDDTVFELTTFTFQTLAALNVPNLMGKITGMKILSCVQDHFGLYIGYIEAYAIKYEGAKITDVANHIKQSSLVSEYNKIYKNSVRHAAVRDALHTWFN